MKVAIIHDWLDKKYGAEAVLEVLLAMFKTADLFTLVDFLPQGQRGFLENRSITTSFIQKLPFASKYFRHFFVLFPLAIEQFDLSKYDVIISSSHAVAKGVIISPHQTHICYVNSQMRYAWDMQIPYLAETNFFKRFFLRYFLHKIRIWEVIAAARVDHFICNSNHSKARLKKTLGRNATTLYPPIHTEFFKPPSHIEKEEFFLAASRLTSYKKVSVIIEAFNKMPDKKLYIAGDGEETENLKKIASANISFLGRLNRRELKHFYQKAKALIHVATEDFGIVMVESMASGTPVIAYNLGGAKEIVTDETGILFDSPDSSSIIAAIRVFEGKKFSREKLVERANDFNLTRFSTQFQEILQGWL